MLKVKKLKELLAQLPDEMEVEGANYWHFVYRQRPKLSDAISICFCLNRGIIYQFSIGDTSAEDIQKHFISEREGAKVKITAHLRSETEKLAKSEANIKRNKELAEAQLEEILKEGE